MRGENKMRKRWMNVFRRRQEMCFEYDSSTYARVWTHWTLIRRHADAHTIKSRWMCVLGRSWWCSGALGAKHATMCIRVSVRACEWISVKRAVFCSRCRHYLQTRFGRILFFSTFASPSLFLALSFISREPFDTFWWSVLKRIFLPFPQHILFSFHLYSLALYSFVAVLLDFIFCVRYNDRWWGSLTKHQRQIYIYIVDVGVVLSLHSVCFSLSIFFSSSADCLCSCEVQTETDNRINRQIG